MTNRVRLTTVALILTALGTWPAAAGAQEAFRVSQMGEEGEIVGDAGPPAVAYSPVDKRHLVVWAGQRFREGDTEIFGRLVDEQGRGIGGQFQISNTGRETRLCSQALVPDVVYNRTRNEFLVVWSGDVNDACLAVNEVGDEYEIYAQRVRPDTFLASLPVRVSTMGPDGDGRFDANTPSVAWQPARDEYLVAWQGDDDGPGLGNNEFEIFAQQLDGAGQVAGPELRVSTLGFDEPTSVPVDGGTTPSHYRASQPNVAANPVDGDYLVTFDGDDYAPPFVNDDFEIWGQRVVVPATLSGSRFRIGSSPPEALLAPARASIAHHPQRNEYLVAWDQQKESGGGSGIEVQVQRIAAAGSTIGSSFPISAPAQPGTYAGSPSRASVVHETKTGGYFVGWQDMPDAVNELELFGRRIDALGALSGERFRISPDLSGSADTLLVDVAAGADGILATWQWAGWNGTNDVEVHAQHAPSPLPPQVEEEPDPAPPAPSEPASSPTPTPTPSPTATPTATPTPTPTPTPPDTVAPALVFPTGPSATRAVVSANGIAVQAGCSEACVLTAEGTVSLPGAASILKLKRVSKTLRARGTTRMVLRLSRRQATRLRKVLRRGTKLKVNVRITARDAAGNTRTVRRRLRIKRA